jgi:ParB family chromosome partitioning protein
MNNIVQIPLSALKPNPYQPPGRLNLTEASARKGGESILRSGLIQIPVGRGADGVYEIGDGWQRKCWHEWLVLNGHKEYDHMPVDLRELTDEQMADLIEETDENKANMTVLDKAWLWKKRLADFPKTTQREFAARRGISQGELSNTIRLLDLPETVQTMIISQEITASHGRALLGLRDTQDIFWYARDAADYKWSVAVLEGKIKERLESQKPKLEEPPPIERTITKVELDHISIDSTEEPVKDLPCNDCPNNVSCDRSKFTTDGQDGYHCEEKDKAVYRASRTEPEDGVGEEEPEKAAAPSYNKKPTKAEELKEAQRKTVAEFKKTSTPAAPAAAAPEPKWKRKLVVEEKGESVLVMLAKEGQPPKIKSLPGTLEEAHNGVYLFITETTAAWLKEGK